MEAGSLPADGGEVTGLGDPCDDHPACRGAANYCATMPGAATGYCTITGCDPDDDACPEGYPLPLKAVE